MSKIVGAYDNPETVPQLDNDDKGCEEDDDDIDNRSDDKYDVDGDDADDEDKDEDDDENDGGKYLRKLMEAHFRAIYEGNKLLTNLCQA